MNKYSKTNSSINMFSVCKKNQSKVPQWNGSSAAAAWELAGDDMRQCSLLPSLMHTSRYPNVTSALLQPGVSFEETLSSRQRKIDSTWLKTRTSSKFNHRPFVNFISVRFNFVIIFEKWFAKANLKRQNEEKMVHVEHQLGSIRHLQL